MLKMVLSAVASTLLVLAPACAQSPGAASPEPTPSAASAQSPSPSPMGSPTASLPASASGTPTPPLQAVPPAEAASTTARADASPPSAGPQLAPGAVKLSVAQGSSATYLVNEQLAGVDFPSDAIGTTDRVTGAIVFGSDGGIISSQSKLAVDLRGLRSDDSRRDRYIQQNMLRTASYPMAELNPIGVFGLAWPLPTAGTATFQLSGDFTVRGVTKLLTWEVTATFSDAQVSGTATTSFTFADFGMSAPRVFVVLSVQETIRLRVQFILSIAESA